MRRLWLIALSGLAFAPAYAAIDSLPLGIFGDEADSVRLQIVEGITGAATAETAQHHPEGND
jgi:hypothetical protein